MSVIHAMGLKDNANLKFPVGLYTTKDMLLGEPPFAVIFDEGGQSKLRVGSSSDSSLRVISKVIVD